MRNRFRYGNMKPKPTPVVEGEKMFGLSRCAYCGAPIEMRPFEFGAATIGKGLVARAYAPETVHFTWEHGSETFCRLACFGDWYIGGMLGVGGMPGVGP